MLTALLKGCRVLHREGVTGIANRVRHRRVGALLQERQGMPQQTFHVMGRGALMAPIGSELGRRRMLNRTQGPTDLAILFNPTLAELDQQRIWALVLDDAYLSAIPQDRTDDFQARLAGHPVIVTSRRDCSAP